MLALRGQKARVDRLAFAPDGLTLVSAGTYTPSIWLWDLAAARPRAILRPAGRGSPVTGLAVAPGGRYLASRHSFSSVVYVWDMTSGQQLAAFPDMGAGDMAFSPDGQVFLASGRQYETAPEGQVRFEIPRYGVHRWAVPGWEEQAPVIAGVARLAALAVSPDGRTLAAAGPGDPSIQLWDLTTGEELRRATVEFEAAEKLLFSPDLRWLASLRSTGIGPFHRSTITIRDTTNGETCLTLNGHARTVNCFAFSPDNSFLATGSDDRTIKFWDLPSGEERACYDWEIGKVLAIAFAQDGMRAAAGSKTDIFIWDLIP